MLTNLKASVVLTMVVLLAAVATTPTAAGPKRRERRVEATYQTPAPAVILLRGGAAVCNHGGAAGSSRGCMEFASSFGERWIRIEVTDATGLPIPGFIAYGDDNIPDWVPFCGSTDSLPVLGSPIWVYVLAYPTDAHGLCHGVATNGTVTATFSNLR